MEGRRVLGLVRRALVEEVLLMFDEVFGDDPEQLGAVEGGRAEPEDLRKEFGRIGGQAEQPVEVEDTAGHGKPGGIGEVVHRGDVLDDAEQGQCLDDRAAPALQMGDQGVVDDPFGQCAHVYAQPGPLGVGEVGVGGDGAVEGGAEGVDRREGLSQDADEGGALGDDPLRLPVLDRVGEADDGGAQAGDLDGGRVDGGCRRAEPAGQPQPQLLEEGVPPWLAEPLFQGFQGECHLAGQQLQCP